MPKSAQRRYRKLPEVVPAASAGLQANSCRNPSCVNFGVDPITLKGLRESGQDRRSGYKIDGSVGESKLVCNACGRGTYPVSNVAVAEELFRIVTRDGLLLSPACALGGCVNRLKPANLVPEAYMAWGKTKAGKPRKRCRSCGKTLTAGRHDLTLDRRHKMEDIVLDIVNGGALRAMARKHGLTFDTLYERIDFIHGQFAAFEAARLQVLRTREGFARRIWWLATDAQDFRLNWTSRERRVPMQLSSIATSDNRSGYVLRADVTADPTIGDLPGLLMELLDDNDFATPEGLGRHDRLSLGPFVATATLVAEKELARLEETRRDHDKRLENLRKIGADPDRMREFVESERHRMLKRLVHTVRAAEAHGRAPWPDRSEQGTPPRGVPVSRRYTVRAHFQALRWMLPEDLKCVLMCDNDATLVNGQIFGFQDRIAAKTADLLVVDFDKKVTIDAKRRLVGEYRTRLKQFLDSLREQGVNDIAPHALRWRFVAAHAQLVSRPRSIQADWYKIPIETMYEPRKQVGIVYERPTSPGEIFSGHRSRLLTYASLHATDSFFGFLRDRTSTLRRPGLSRTSETFYDKFQHYRADMPQKIIDIARIFYNWCELRPLAMSREVQLLTDLIQEPGSHAELTAKRKRKERNEKRRADKATPAMRLGVAAGPVRVADILYNDWAAEAWGDPGDPARSPAPEWVLEWIQVVDAGGNKPRYGPQPPPILEIPGDNNMDEIPF